MSFLVSFIVPGQPVGKARARVTRTGHAYTPRKTVDYERSVAWIARAAMKGAAPLPHPMAIHVRMRFAVPKSWPRVRRELALSGGIMPTGKPDADNVLKTIKDALNGVVYVDDSQVVEGTFSKRYGPESLVEVTVETTE